MFYYPIVLFFIFYNMKKLSVLIAVLALWVGGFLPFAASRTIGVSSVTPIGQTNSAKMTQNWLNVADEAPIRVDPDYPLGGNVTYNLDALSLKDYVTNNKPTIMKVRCDGKEILKSLGITNAKVVSVGIQEWDFTFSYDFNNCSFWANRTVRLQPTDSITDEDALKMAKDFVGKSEALGYFKKLVWDPIITYRNNYDTLGVMREGKNFWVSIVFPIKVAGKTVYQTYGEPLGLYVEVNNKWVNSVSAQILPFAFLRADSYKLGADDLISFLKKGGNNPYYTYNMGQDFKAEIKATSYDKIRVFTQKYPQYGGYPSLYLSSWIRIKTDSKIDNGPGQEKKDYSMIVSDYKIGNNQIY